MTVPKTPSPVTLPLQKDEAAAIANGLIFQFNNVIAHKGGEVSAFYKGTDRADCEVIVGPFAHAVPTKDEVARMRLYAEELVGRKLGGDQLVIDERRVPVAIQTNPECEPEIQYFTCAPKELLRI